jgi:hypothetical protein
VPEQALLAHLIARLPLGHLQHCRTALTEVRSAVVVTGVFELGTLLRRQLDGQPRHGVLPSPTFWQRGYYLWIKLLTTIRPVLSDEWRPAVHGGETTTRQVAQRY